ncbi:hypothetical protein [Piscibacillus salipiscarius]|nr:hypothetical protein [Piscibacillus salipiscarius]
MSSSLAEDHIDTLIEERDGELYLSASEFPVFINTNEDYQTSQIDDETYQVTQENDSELRGHLEITFTINKRQDAWIVDQVNVNNLDQNSAKIDSDVQAEEEVLKALQLGESYQASYDGQEPPSEDYADQNLARIQVYEENDNARATYGWYYINMDNRSIYEYEVATNELTLIFQYENGSYNKVTD